MATPPLFVAAKHEEPYEFLNPSIQLLARPAGPLEGQKVTAVFEIVVPVLRRQCSAFSMEGEIETLSIAGQQSATMTTHTLVTHGGREFTTKSTINLFLVHGDPKGLRTAELSNWTGRAFCQTYLASWHAHRELDSVPG